MIPAKAPPTHQACQPHINHESVIGGVSPMLIGMGDSL